ncbi:MAG: UvrD-helicase domain-containing protein [Candidatus Abawacabacteria bacterium]|nr:UvrD-helicase domain-containing protein [Candidatus Abawacabacteria bacterium]
MNIETLNEQQREVVTHLGGPLLVLAGAGSGKTKALTYRVAYLMADRGIDGNRILAVTFTNKAAQEMRNRVEKLLQEAGPASGTPLLGTFHSICARFLRADIHYLGFKNSFVIYDTNDQLQVLREVLARLNLDPKKFVPQAVLGCISQAKSELIAADQYKLKARDYFEETVAQIYPLYEQALHANNALDFDDLIFKTVQLFQHFPEVLDRYQERFHYFLVDEYQDTNHAQYTFLKLLAEKYRNLMVVGDDWQGIYSWRGADIRNILNFEKDYPEAKMVKLERNYRSTQLILDASHSIIEKNRTRTDKKLWTDREQGDLIEVVEAYDEREEAMLIAEKIRTAECALRDQVVLYRTNAQSRPLEEALLRLGISYQIVGGVRFYERQEIKDVLAYLSLIVNPQNTIALQRIINVPPRKIGKIAWDKIKIYFGTEPIAVNLGLARAYEMGELNAGTKQAIGNFLQLLQRLQELGQEMTASQLIKAVVERTGYKEYLLDGTEEGEERYQNVQELLTVSQKYDHLAPEFSLATFLEEVALISDMDNLKDEKNGVTLMSVHAAKGLEFSTVYIAGLEENIFPHSRTQLDPEQSEEERRLMYVAMTRAAHKLYLFYTRRRSIYGNIQSNSRSRFIDEIPQHLVSQSERSSPRLGSLGNAQISIQQVQTITAEVLYKTGEKVRHKSFGDGLVVEVRGDVISVAFPGKGVKKLAASIAPLEKLA